MLSVSDEASEDGSEDGSDMASDDASEEASDCAEVVSEEVTEAVSSDGLAADEGVSPPPEHAVKTVTAKSKIAAPRDIKESNFFKGITFLYQKRFDLLRFLSAFLPFLANLRSLFRLPKMR